MRQTVGVPHGGGWTQDKLGRLRKYLEAYTTIFTSNENARFFQTTYVDAFAGTGYSKPKTKKAKSDTSVAVSLFEMISEPEAEEYLKGSARIALEVEPRFNSYLFIEQKAAHYEALEGLKEEFPDLAGDMTIVKQDANTYLTEWCERMDTKKNRAVVFLDPFGMEVKWTLLQAIAKTEAIDLWLLFPIGGINRHLTRSNLPPQEWTDRLTQVLGTEEWLSRFYTVNTQPENPNQLDLFNEGFQAVPEATLTKEVDFEKLGAYFVERLETLFPSGGVAKNPLVLRNSTNAPLFLFCFASANPKGAKTAVKIANDILRR